MPTPIHPAAMGLRSTSVTMNHLWHLVPNRNGGKNAGQFWRVLRLTSKWQPGGATAPERDLLHGQRALSLRCSQRGSLPSALGWRYPAHVGVKLVYVVGS